MATSTRRQPDYIFLKNLGYATKSSKIYIEHNLPDKHPTYVVKLIGTDKKLYLVNPWIELLEKEGFIAPSTPDRSVE